MKHTCENVLEHGNITKAKLQKLRAKSSSDPNQTKWFPWLKMSVILTVKAYSSSLVLHFQTDWKKKNGWNWGSRGWDILTSSPQYGSSSKNTVSCISHNATVIYSTIISFNPPCLVLPAHMFRTLWPPVCNNSFLLSPIPSQDNPDDIIKVSDPLK